MRYAGILMVVLIGCNPVTPTGALLEPVQLDPIVVTAPVVAVDGDEEAPVGVQDGFDFDAEGGEEDADAAEALTDLELQAKLLGVDPRTLAQPEPVAATPVAPSVVVQTAAPIPDWNPEAPLEAAWGIRLISTLHEVQPPRAVIALPSGEEVVVQPGTMLPDAHLVIIAIGKTAIQVARVTPQGFYAKIETETVASLFAPAAVP